MRISATLLRLIPTLALLLAAACADQIPVDVESEQGQSQAKPVLQQHDGTERGSDPPVALGDPAMEALAQWIEGLSHLVIEVELTVENVDSSVEIKGRANRDLLAGRDWLYFDLLRTTDSELVFQVISGTDELYVFSEDSGWISANAADVPSYEGLIVLLQLDLLLDESHLSGLVRCLETPIGSTSETTRQGRAVWQIQCSGDTAEAGELGAVATLIEQMASPITALRSARDSEESEEEQSEDSSQTESVHAFLLLAVEKETGALLAFEQRMEVHRGDGPPTFYSYSASLVQYNQPFSFPDLTE